MVLCPAVRRWRGGVPTIKGGSYSRQTTPRVFLSEGKFEPHCFRGPGFLRPILKALATPTPLATRIWTPPARISSGTTRHGASTTHEHHIGVIVIDDLHSKGARHSACGRSAPQPNVPDASMVCQRLACITPRASSSPLPCCDCPARVPLQLSCVPVCVVPMGSDPVGRELVVDSSR